MEQVNELFGGFQTYLQESIELNERIVATMKQVMELAKLLNANTLTDEEAAQTIENLQSAAYHAG